MVCRANFNAKTPDQPMHRTKVNISASDMCGSGAWLTRIKKHGESAGTRGWDRPKRSVHPGRNRRHRSRFYPPHLCNLCSWFIPFFDSHISAILDRPISYLAWPVSCLAFRSPRPGLALVPRVNNDDLIGFACLQGGLIDFESSPPSRWHHVVVADYDRALMRGGQLRKLSKKVR
ncbi:hypothetical protein BH09VER1_BH09VER1_50740 [soil metagenome]